MAYHLACPLTCRKICYCRFGEQTTTTTTTTAASAAAAASSLSSSSSSASASASWKALSLKVQEISNAALARADLPWHVLPFEAGKTVDVVVPSLVKDVKKNKRRNPPDAPARGNGHRHGQQGQQNHLRQQRDGRERNAIGGGVASADAGEDGGLSNVATPGGRKTVFKGGGKFGVSGFSIAGATDGGGASGSGSRTNALRTKKFGGSSSSSGKFRFSRPAADAKAVARSFVFGGGGAAPRAGTESATDASGSSHGRHGGGGGHHPSRFTPVSEESRQQSQASRAACGLCTSPSPDLTGKAKDSRMLSCSGCSRQYHKLCVQRWAEFRDLFDWSSWLCPSCRMCEVCRQAGEANKLMFCKRCDNALHVYCQQPPLKHVPKGPYLCPKHTVCHSCGSNVPGSGVSSKWFMSFTTCDACGRLFAKDKYCPVCLKVYRDSESKPMVRCDSCEHWVHCQCDGIGDELFNRFQSDDNLRYECAACRGDCPKVNTIEDAVRELWRRKDEIETDQRSKLNPAAGYSSARDRGRDGGQLQSSDDDDSKDAEVQERGGREVFTGQRNNLKRPRGKWLPQNQKRSEQRQRLLSSVAIQN